MNQKGNAPLIAIISVALLLVVFFVFPIGGTAGAFRDACLSFMLHQPPRFVAVKVTIDGSERTIKAGQTIRIKGEQYLEIKQIDASTFFKKYLSADVPGFGKDNDLGNNLDLTEIRNQLIAAGLRSIPVEIHYLGRKIAQVPIEIDLTEDDYRARIKAAKDNDERLSLLKHAYQSFPANREFLIELEDRLLAKRDFAGLVEIYKSITEADPDDINAYAKLAGYYQDGGQLEDALKTCQHIVDQGRASVATYRRMAFIAGQLGQAEQRIAYLKEALKLEPKNEGLVLDLGSTYEQTGRANQAVNLYQNAAPQAKSKNILVPVIEESLKRRDYAGAEKSLQQYVRQYPNDANAWSQLAEVAGKQGKTADQARNYAKAASLAPNDKVIANNLALAYDHAGDQAQALKAYRRLAELNPNDANVKSRIAELALAQKNWPEAYEAYKDLSAASPNAANLSGLVKAAASLKSNDKVIDATALYLKHKSDEKVLLLRGAALENRAAGKKATARLSDLDAALSCYRKALSLNKSSQAQDRIPELKIQIMRLKRSGQDD